MERLIFYAAGLRGVAIGFISVYLGFDLARRGVSPFQAGLVIGAGLFGNMAAAFLVGLPGTRIGSRTLMIIFSLLMALGGFALSQNLSFFFLLLFSFLGMVNGMGKDRGGLRALDQAVLPSGGGNHERTLAFAHYNVILDIGGALGAVLAALPGAIARLWRTGSLSLGFWSYSGYAVLLIASSFFYAMMKQPDQIPREDHGLENISMQSREKIRRLSFLFSIDSLGGGFLTSALIAYWFFNRFHVQGETLALLFFAARILNLFSNYGSVWIARKIGLVRTMVFTHLPSSLLLIAAAFAPAFGLAAFLFLLRESLVQMDVPTRESYTMAVVKPHERTFASGITNIVRNLGWAVTPAFGGAGMAALFPGFSLVAGSVSKIAYDVLLYMQFRNIRPPEEQG